ncbi:hypothetical protein AQUSIP_10620 [Aquicella siphonis]|uniref:Uncharacterized protein n=1 Tax=Aquicella siphonis TaxID=254247 RepID=A0A5E4PGX6_9COXI|nr:hypothetical protein [Aquicella siphonis]VVC75768.1 hypothetical protein AQUSIP_10620 [Aquicella siphonis]
MLTSRLYGLLLLSAVLAGCATGYGPAGEVGGFEYGGYTDQRIDENTVVVTFRGNSSTSGSTAYTYLLYRCAQVTLSNGYDYFIIISSSNSSMNLNIKTRPTTYSSGLTNPPKLYTTYYYPEQYQSMSMMNTATPGYYPNQHGAVAVIKMFSGKAPAHKPRVYVARDVIAHLGPAAF